MKPKEMKKKILWLGLSFLLVVALVLTGCPAPVVEEPVVEEPPIKNPDTFIYATIGARDTMDPAYAYDTASGEIIQAVYETLIFFDGESTQGFVPVLATEWNISADGKTYRFKIREGVKFHNGNALTAEDVEYSIERGMVQDYGGGPQWMLFEPLFGTDTHSSRTDDGLIPLAEIKSKVEVDGDWVQFNLVAPYAPFLQILANTWGSIVDKEWSIANGDWDGTQASYEELNDPASGDSPLQSIANGTGPFELERWEPGIETSLVRNDNYWGEAANFERVIIKVVDEWTTRKLMLIAGDADSVYVPRAYIEELEDVVGLLVYKDLPQLQVDGVFFQFAISEESTYVGSGKLDGEGIPLDFFTDINVRKGFAYAFDWDVFISEVLVGEGVQVGSPIIEGLGYVNPNQPMYEYDPDKAEEYFEAAWDGAVWENGFQFTATYNVGNDVRKIALEILQKNLLGINENFHIAIQPVQWSSFLRGMIAQTLPLFVIGWRVDYPDAHNFAFPFMHSAGTFSGWQSYSDPYVDALIADGIGTTDPTEREAIYYELGQIYYDDVPSIALAQSVGRRYFRDWVKGFYYNPVLPSNLGNIYALSKEY